MKCRKEKRNHNGEIEKRRTLYNTFKKNRITQKQFEILFSIFFYKLISWVSNIALMGIQQ